MYSVVARNDTTPFSKVGHNCERIKPPFMLLYLQLPNIFGLRKEVMNIEECYKNDPSTSAMVRNITLVASLGDSVLAGYGARQRTSWPSFNFLDFKEDRGATAINGGDSDMISIFNMIKSFNPDVQGGSYNSHFINVCSDKLCFWPFNRFHKSDGLNMAASGSFASDMMYHTRSLVHRIKQMYIKQPKLKKSWKFVALWVGLNDQCRYCDREKSKIDKFQMYIKDVVDYLRLHLEFVIIDVISLWNIDKLVDLSLNHSACKSNFRQTFFKIHCTCGFGKNYKETRKGMALFQKRQNKVLSDMVESFQNGSAWNAKDSKYLGQQTNFKLIYDPSSEEMDLNEYHWSIITKTDCSHPSKETHERLASVLWYNLFRNSTEKLRNQKWAFQKPYLRFSCPGDIQFQ